MPLMVNMIAHLQRTFEMQKYRPTIYKIKLPCPSYAKFKYVLALVTTFDFRHLLYSLLSDPEINTPENLTIDPDHPFSEYPCYRCNAETNKLETIPYGEVHSGDWYHRTWSKMVRHTNSKKVGSTRISSLGSFSTPTTLFLILLAVFVAIWWIFLCQY